MMNLYELTENYNKALDDLLNIDNLDDQVFADTMEGLELELEDKIFNSACYMQNLKAEADAMEQAESRIKTRRLALNNKIDRLGEYVRVNLENSGLPKIERPELKISLRKGVESVNVLDSSAVPSDYLTILTASSIDKVKAKKALKLDVKIDGLELKRSESSLVIK